MIKQKIYRAVLFVSVFAVVGIPHSALANNDDIHTTRTRTIASLFRHLVILSEEADCLPDETEDCCTTDCGTPAPPPPNPNPGEATRFQNTEGVGVPMGGLGSVTVTCPMNYNIVSGGVSFSAVPTPHAGVTESMPVCIQDNVVDKFCTSGANGWLATVANYEPVDTLIEITAYAICKP